MLAVLIAVGAVGFALFQTAAPTGIPEHELAALRQALASTESGSIMPCRAHPTLPDSIEPDQALSEPMRERDLYDLEQLVLRRPVLRLLQSRRPCHEPTHLIRLQLSDETTYDMVISTTCMSIRLNGGETRPLSRQWASGLIALLQSKGLFDS